MSFEDKIRDKFSQQEWEPQTDRWERVRAAIQPEKKKRRFIFWWLGAALLAIGMSLTLLFWPDAASTQQLAVESGQEATILPQQDAATNNNVPLAKDAETVVASKASKIPAKVEERPDAKNSKTALTNSFPKVKDYQEPVIESYSTTGTKLTNHKDQSQAVDAGVELPSGDLPIAAAPETAPEDLSVLQEVKVDSGKLTQTAVTKDSTPVNTATVLAQSDDPRKDLVDPDKRKESNRKKITERPFSIGAQVSAGVWQSQLSAPGSANIYNNSIRLNRDIRKTGFHTTQSVFFTAHFHKNWRAGIGIGLMQCYQDLEYDFVVTANDPTIGIADKFYNESYNGDPASVLDRYKNANDSIMKGSRYVTHNRYYWREVPLYVEYLRPLGPRLNCFAGAGLTYQYVYYVDILTPDIDNVGMVVADNKKDFPRIRNTVTGNLRAGLEYELYEGFYLNTVLNTRYSFRSIVASSNWVQERPYGAGLGISLLKKF